MKPRRITTLLLAAGLFPATGLQAQNVQHYKTEVFDPKGSVYTIPMSQNLQGTIAGYWIDGNGLWHGFLYNPGSPIETIDVPGAGTVGTFGQGTQLTDINDEGVTCGIMQDSGNNIHGFIRQPNGRVTLYDDPSEQPLNYFPGYAPLTTFTCFWSLGDLDQSVGAYYDANGISHGLLRTSFGYTLNFDPPGAVNGTDVYNYKNINSLSLVTGGFYDASWNEHGFLRLPDGAFIMLDPQGAAGSWGCSINELGTVTGAWYDAAGVAHGLVRPLAGTPVSFDVPGLPAGTGTVGTFTNDLGTTVGFLFLPNGSYRGFLRGPDGKYQLLDAMTPLPTGSGQGTSAHSITNAGQIAGRVGDANGVVHGFVMLPVK